METLAMLVAYGMELGGSYVCDPMDPYVGDCDFRIDAVTSPERLRAWFDKDHYLKGLSLHERRPNAPLPVLPRLRGRYMRLCSDSHQAWEASMWGYRFSTISSFSASETWSCWKGLH